MVVYKFKTSDGIVEVDGELLKCSIAFQDALKVCSNDDVSGLIPLPQFNSNTMKLFIEWAKHYKDDPLFTKSASASAKNDVKNLLIVPDWDNTFFGSLDIKTINCITMFALYFQISKLFDDVSTFSVNMVFDTDEFMAIIKRNRELTETFEVPTRKRVRNQEENDEDDTTSSDEGSKQEKQTKKSKISSKKRARNQEENNENIATSSDKKSKRKQQSKNSKILTKKRAKKPEEKVKPKTSIG